MATRATDVRSNLHKWKKSVSLILRYFYQLVLQLILTDPKPMVKVTFDTQLIRKASMSCCNWLTDTVVKEVNVLSRDFEDFSVWTGLKCSGRLVVFFTLSIQYNKNVPNTERNVHVLV